MVVLLSKEDGMRFSRCQRVMVRAAAAVLALCVATSSVAVAKPKPGQAHWLPTLHRGRSSSSRRTACSAVSSRPGQMCATGSSTVGGGIWPRGTADQYIFGSGINLSRHRRQCAAQE